MLKHRLTRREWLQGSSAGMTVGLLANLSWCEQGAWSQDGGGLPRVLPAGRLPEDRRLQPPKDLDGDFSWTPPATVAEWEVRAERLRRQVLVACGLWPMPARPAIQATIHQTVEREGYTVEAVSFESHAGLWVTGSLYRPTNHPGPRPTVLCPHGHWADARFYEHSAAQMEKELKLGGEKFPESGRAFLQGLCVQLTRMGCNAFFYDMLGYSDNQTLSYDLTHRFAKQRPEFSQPDRWGLFSAQSELRCINVLGMQTWNSIRILDWLTSLPDVDAERIGVTGASGGGTQTFLLGCVDPRPIAFFPAVMVSTAMQGGCTCENASYLRIETGNIELAALLAPRYLGMSGANDWTRAIESKGLPELKAHYAKLGVPDRVMGKYLPFEHNFNHPSRRLMYEVFAKAFGLPESVSLDERDFVPLSKAEATIWKDGSGGLPADRALAEQTVLQGFAREYDQQLAALVPTDRPALAEYRRVIGGGWQILLGHDLAQVGSAIHVPIGEAAITGGKLYSGLVKNTTRQTETPAWSLMPETWNEQLVIWLTETGKAGLFAAGQTPLAPVATLLQQGFAIIGLDLFGQGEFTVDGQPWAQAPVVKNPREFLGYTAGYNWPLVAERVMDGLSLIRAAQVHESRPAKIHLVGTGAAAVVAAGVAVQAGAALDRVIVATEGWRFGRITEIRDPQLVPGALRYGDLPGLLALRAPHPLWWSDSGRGSFPVRMAYRALDAHVTIASDPHLKEAVAWLASRAR